MKISPIVGQQAVHRYQNIQRQVAEQNTPVQKNDALDLSTDAVSFASVLKAAKSAEFVRSPQESKRLAEISKQIENGTYNVDGRDVAQKMLENIGVLP